MMQDIPQHRHRSPAVQRLVADLTAQIRSGALRPGDYLPSAQTLAARYGIGYVSVIRAYKTLNAVGLVETVQGRGAFVSGAKAAAPLREVVVVMPSQGALSSASNPHSDWVFQGLLSGMNEATLARGIRLQLLFADAVAPQWRAVYDGLDGDAGVLFVMAAPPAWVLRLQRRAIPYAVVLPDRLDELTLEMPHIYADYFGGVRAAVSRVVAGGRRKAAYLGITEDSNEVPRYEGYQAAVTGAGGQFIETLDCPEISREGGRRVMEHYLASHAVLDFDLLVAGNDLRALGAMDALAAHGNRVPQEVAVLGFDDIPASAAGGLSTIRLPIREIGEQSVRWFLDDVAGQSYLTPPSLKLPCESVWRASTGD